jgi:hypothetical protein
MSTTPDSPPRELVRARVEDADRQRRLRETSRRLWRVAPIAAAACLAIAGLGRVSGWSPYVSIGVIVLTAAGIGLAAFLARRPRTVTDADAAAIDAQAALNGELRSAHWFVQNAGNDADGWIDFHVRRAAESIQRINWSDVYPADPASRAKAATVVFAAAALALAIVFPGRASIAASNGRAAAEAEAKKPTLADVIQQLEGLLADAELGQGRALTAAEMQQLFSQLDKLRAERGAKGLKNEGKPGAPSEADLKALAERAKNASENTANDPHVRDQLAEMAEKLSEPGAQNAEKNEPRDASEEGQQPGNDLSKSSSSSGDAPAGAQSVKEASSSAAVGVVMMTNNGGGGKEASFAVSGGQELAGGRGQMPDLAAALRKETVESAQDNEGEKDVAGERRQTERGTATAAYAHTAAAPAGRGRSAAPPVVPESRRPALRSYFIRKQ